LDVSAPLPPHMAKLWDMFGFDKDDKRDHFKDAEAELSHASQPRDRRSDDRKLEHRPRRGKVRGKG
jgi:hypothetical protein